MEPLLTPEELRVLGCLIEKGITTPDYYPMTLNALTAACNQKTNRAPVVQYDEKTVVRALDSLRDKELTRVVSGHDMRVPKYYHRFTDARGFSGPEVAVLCELMLAGAPDAGGGRAGVAARPRQPHAPLRGAAPRWRPCWSRRDGRGDRLPGGPGRRGRGRQAAPSARIQGVPLRPPARGSPRDRRELQDRAARRRPRGRGREGPPRRPEAARLAAAAEDQRLERLEAAVAMGDDRGDRLALRESAFEEFRRQFE